MAKKSIEVDSANIELDMEEIQSEGNKIEVPKEEYQNTKIPYKKAKREQNKELINCLRNQRIIVRYVPKLTGLVSDTRHVLYGGMAETATRTFVVPKLSSGIFVNVLTDDEKAFLEVAMGLEDNALSIYKKHDNFWSDANENGISKVVLTKQDNYLDLSNPEDYIRYKILLANKDYIAPSLQALQDTPKASYQYVIIADDEENKVERDKMSTVMRCYKEYGKVENDADILRLIIETMSGRALAVNTKLEYLQTEINKYIQSNSKTFIKIITDPLLPTKVLIRKAVDKGVISKRADYYYLKRDNTPLCNNGEEPILSIAAAYLNLARNQETKFYIEASIRD